MSERVAGSQYQQLHHFIADSKWSAEAVMREVARKTAVSARVARRFERFDSR